MRKGNKLIEEGKVPKKRTLNTQVLTDIVNGYYLDGIEAGYKAGYDYGYEVGKKDYDQNNKQFDLGYKSGIENGYQKGLEDGRKQGVAIDGDKRYWDGYHAAQEDGKKIYQKGLDDAWAAARKIAVMPFEKRKIIFGCDGYMDIVEKNTATEAIEKIREYEEKQEIEKKRVYLADYCTNKHHDDCGDCPLLTEDFHCGEGVGWHYPETVKECGDINKAYDLVKEYEEKQKQEKPQDDEIKIGDEVIYNGNAPHKGEKGFVMGLCGEWVEVRYLSSWNCVGVHKDTLTRTGRHFDGIENTLKQMRGEV